MVIVLGFRLGVWIQSDDHPVSTATWTLTSAASAQADASLGAR
jgi:hypothetical protein